VIPLAATVKAGDLTVPLGPDTENTAAPFAANDVAALRAQFGVRFVVVDHSKLGIGCAAVDAALTVLRAHRLLGHDARYEVIDLAQPADSSSGH